MRTILTFALLAIVPPLQAAAPPTSPVRLTLDEALRRACQGLPTAKHKEARSRTVRAALDYLAARAILKVAEFAEGQATETLAFARSKADRYRASGQREIFRGQRLDRIDVRNEHLRTLRKALGVPDHREIVLTDLDNVASRPLPNAKQIDEASPRHALFAFHVARHLLEKCMTEPRLAFLKPALAHLARLNQNVIDRREYEYDVWKNKIDQLKERLKTVREQRNAYWEQHLVRQAEYVANRNTMDLWLESQRYYREMLMEENSYKYELVKMVLMRPR